MPAGVAVAVLDIPSVGGGRVGKFCESALEIDSKFEESTENWACWFGLLVWGVGEDELAIFKRPSYFAFAGGLTKG